MNTGNPPQPQYPGYAQGAPQYPQAAYYPQGPQGPQQQQQQSTNVGVVGAGSPIQPTYQTRPYISFTGAILLSCFSIWCCGNLLIGGIAFFVACKWHSIQHSTHFYHLWTRKNKFCKTSVLQIRCSVYG